MSDFAKNAEENIVIHTHKKVQEINVSPNFAKICCPSRLVVAGPTMSGKSTFALQLIRHRATVYSHSFSRIIYAFPEESLHLHQTFIQDLRNACNFIEIVEGLPHTDEYHLDSEKTSHKLVILDDLMMKAFSSESILELITRTSHHSNISVVIVTQSMFLPAKHRLTLIRNCSEKVIFHDKIDQMQLSILSRQILPSKPNFLRECFDFIYQHTSKHDLKYVLIDASPLSELPYNAVARSFIFPKADGKTQPIFFFP